MKRLLAGILTIIIVIATSFIFSNAQGDNGGWNRTFIEEKRDCFPPPGDCLDDIVINP